MLCAELKVSRSRRLATALAVGALVTATAFQGLVATAAGADTAAAPTTLPTVTQDVSPLSEFDAEVLRLSNVKRAEAGVPALLEARGLDSLSTWWSNQEATGATAGALLHNPDGMTMVQNYGATNRTAWGENVVRWSPATATAQDIFDAYWASASHKANLLSASYAYIGIGTVTNAAGVSFNTINFTDAADAGQTFDPKVAATPIGHYESASVTGATVRLQGWAIDPDITTNASVVKVTDTAADGTVSSYAATANVSRTDVGLQYRKSGDAHGFDYSFVTANRGTHNLCATVVNQGDGTGDVALGCLTYLVGDPIGALTSATATGGTLSLVGWAVDPDQPTSPATVTITDSLSGGTPTTTTLVADRVNLGVDHVVPGAGSNHAFVGTAAISGIGAHNVCATAAGIRSASVVTSLGCKTVTIAPAQPIGVFDTAAAPTRDTVSIAGWAADPDFPTTGVTVNVTITNSAGSTTTTNNVADQPYPTEVAAGFGRNHAFTATLPLSTDGLNTVCVTAVSHTDWHIVRDLGCKDVTVNWLSGSLDKLTPATSTANVRTVKIEGWAVDRGNMTATATVKLDVTAPNGTVTTTSVPANTLRADVGRAIPGAGNNHGYITTVRVAAAGNYQVCSTVISTRNSAVSKLLFCLTVAVR